MRIPANIEDTGEILNDVGEVDGYLEEAGIAPERFTVTVEEDVDAPKADDQGEADAVEEKGGMSKVKVKSNILKTPFKNFAVVAEETRSHNDDFFGNRKPQAREPQ